MILDSTIVIKKSPKTYKHYIDKGYIFNEENEITINVNDLPKNSHVKIRVECDMCHKQKTISYFKYMKNFNNGGYYSCSNKCSVSKCKNTFIQKYGTDILYNVESIKEKAKQTSISKYGCEYPAQNDQIKDKIKKTNLLKYGTNSYLSTEENRIKMIDYFKNNKEKIVQKRQKTNLIKYGCEHPAQNDEIKQKTKDTNLKLYGSKNGINKEKYFKTLVNNFKNKYNNVNFLKIDHKNQLVTLHCDKCNENYSINFGLFRDRYLRKNLDICVLCNPIGSFSTSNEEKELLNFIKENYKGIIKTNIKLIKKYELDIYLPELNLAFEFNGVYWHNELNKPNNYHKDKTETFLKKGIQLIHIYEDDWIHKNDIIKSMILNKLNKTPNRIFARKCEIKEIKDIKLTRNFLNINHLQGYTNSNINIGLYYKHELISLMTFGKLRKPMNSKSKNTDEYEMIRFCNKLNTNVIGGADKLFKYFINKYNPSDIISYANRDYSNGNLYKILNFNLISITRPNYYYVINNKREYRYKYRKDILIKQGYDPNKTEHEIMLERKIYRIYNSGNLKFKWTNENKIN